MLELREGTWAVVTGASSGIGEAIAERLAARRFPLVLVARSAERLAALAERLRETHGTAVVPLPVDLAAPGGPAAVWAATEEAGRPVELLVNNAGFGLNDALADLPGERVAEMLRLNVLATTELLRLAVAAMRSRRRGFVLNVSSTAGAAPFPYFAPYGASKAYLRLLSEAVHEEAAADGVVVTALCPGFTRTRFAETASMADGSRTLFPVLSAGDVADAGLHALSKGKAVHVPHPFDRLWIASLRLAPRWLPVKLGALTFRATRRPRGG